MRDEDDAPPGLDSDPVPEWMLREPPKLDKTARPTGPRLIACEVCGTSVSSQARACPKCGQPTKAAMTTPRRSKGLAFILCFFLGGLGAHRFYTGHIGIGVIYFCTLGLFYVGAIADLFLILLDRYEDAEGRKLV